MKQKIDQVLKDNFMKKHTLTFALFGASGRTGKEMLTLAEKYNLKIRAVVREKSSFKPQTNVEIVTWDYKNNKRLAKIIGGCEAVVIVFGPKPPFTDLFCAETTKNIIKAMEKLKVRRLICQTGAMIGDYRKNRSLLFELMSRIYEKNSPRGYQDRVGQEDAIAKSSLNWTIIKPPRLTDSSIAEKVSLGADLVIGLLSSISRQSLAQAIIKELLHPQFIGEKIFIRKGGI